MSTRSDLLGIIGYAAEVSEPNGRPIVGYYTDQHLSPILDRLVEYVEAQRGTDRVINIDLSPLVNMIVAKVVDDLTEAIRLTAEYCGVEVLPPFEGWSWYDALLRYAPEKAAAFRAEFDNDHGWNARPTDG